MDVVQYSLPQRRDRIRQLRDSGTSDYNFQLLFRDQLRTFSVYTVDIGLPCYRLGNGRTRAAQLELIATEGLPADFFSADPDSEPALNKQDEILRQMINEAGLLRAFKKVHQDQPLILDNDGYIVNGNRRICAMRQLLAQDEETYAHFKHVQVIFLPPCGARDIKELEGRLQVQPDLRADYSWTAEAMLYRDLRDQGWQDEQIASLYQKKVPDIRELIAMLEDAEQYLETRGSVGRYSLVLKKEYAFRQLQKSRRKCGDDEPRKQMLTSVAYLMVDDPDTTEGRLYESIPDAYKYLDSVTNSIGEEFSEEIRQQPRDDDGFGILGGDIGDKLAGIVRILNVPCNRERARDVIRDTIEERRNQERERKDAAYCFRQVQQAYTRLQSALSALEDESETTGIEDALANIEATISDIRDWLSNANNKT